jgi:serine/threonine protein kinase
MTQGDTYVDKQVGNYRIEKEIASGSFGTVYLARHLHLRERVAAIKIMHLVRFTSEEEKNNFLKEAQILERLKGLPNILPLLDVGVDGNVPYMVTEYAEQGSLRMYIRKRGSSLLSLQALKIIEQIGRGLQGAHDKGIVHRDLKPENILFNTKGEALLADFGISTALSTASVRDTQHTTGTPGYMAPEQIRGKVCKESDQYALACIAYELLTRHKLFDTPDFTSMCYLHINEAPIPPRQHNSQISEAVEHAILKALSKQRADRYPNVSAFIAALKSQPPRASARSQGYTSNTSTVAKQPDSTPKGDTISAASPPQQDILTQSQYITPSLVHTPVEQSSTVEVSKPEALASRQDVSIVTPQPKDPSNYPPTTLSPSGADVQSGYSRYTVRGWMRFAALFFYLVPIVSLVVYFATGTKNIFLRFHFFQSILMWLLWLVITILLIITVFTGILPKYVENIIGILWLIWHILSIIAALSSWRGKFFSIPVLWYFADRFAYEMT